MNRPEYWEDDETWDAYEQWKADHPEPAPEPLSHLGRAIAKARGDILTEEDMKESIGFLNALSRAILKR